MRVAAGLSTPALPVLPSSPTHPEVATPDVQRSVTPLQQPASFQQSPASHAHTPAPLPTTQTSGLRSPAVATVQMSPDRELMPRYGVENVIPARDGEGVMSQQEEPQAALEADGAVGQLPEQVQVECDRSS